MNWKRFFLALLCATSFVLFSLGWVWLAENTEHGGKIVLFVLLFVFMVAALYDIQPWKRRD